MFRLRSNASLLLLIGFGFFTACSSSDDDPAAPGAAGKDGVDGKDGTDGKNAKNGTDGKNLTTDPKTDPDPTVKGDVEKKPLRRIGYAMARPNNCGELKDAAQARLFKQIEAATIVNSNPDKPRDDIFTPGMPTAPGAPTAGPGGGSPPTAPPTASGGAGPGTDGGNAEGDGPKFSATNTQVDGVDEADFLKNDGENLYLLSGGALSVIAAQAGGQLEALAKLELGQVARDMFVVETAAGKRLIAIYSDVSADSFLEVDYSDPNAWRPFTKLTLVAFADNALTVESEHWFEGGYISARRSGNRVRAALNYWENPTGLRLYPTQADATKAQLLVLERLAGRSVLDVPSAEMDTLLSTAQADVLKQANVEVLASLSGQDFVPEAYVRRDGKIVATPIGCEDVYIPDSANSYWDGTYLPELDLSAPAEAGGVALMSSSETLYQNNEVLALSLTQYDEKGVHTDLHQFEITQDNSLAYVASGKVAGHLLNQFSLDEKNGTLRVVSNQDQKTRLSLLQANSNKLEIVGEVKDIAPGENVHAVRYVGDTAYVVTFRNIDPLFVFDVADPTQPKLLGEVEIPGFSQYIHPIGDSHLLTIGVRDDLNGLALRLFDVSDKTKPKLAHLHELSPDVSSAATYDHRAFTYFAEQRLLALPVQSWGWSQDYCNYTVSGKLSLFSVSTADGISSAGELSTLPLVRALTEAGECGGFWDAGYRSVPERGTFIDEHIYAVARGGVVAAKIATPNLITDAQAVATECGVPNGMAPPPVSVGGSSGMGVGGANTGGSPPDGMGVSMGGVGPSPDGIGGIGPTPDGMGGKDFAPPYGHCTDPNASAGGAGGAWNGSGGSMAGPAGGASTVPDGVGGAGGSL